MNKGLKAVLGLSVLTLAATNPALAAPIITAADVTSATGSAGAEEAMQAGALWAIGLAVAAAVIVKVLGIVKK